MADLDRIENGKPRDVRDEVIETRPMLKYVGRPTHYQTEVHVEAGETIELDLPNGRIPIFMDFVGDLHLPQPRNWFDVFFPKKPELVVQSGAFILQWYFSIDDEGNQVERVSIDFAYKADGIIRVLLVEPDAE